MDDWIGSVRGVVLDLDGTVYDDGGLFDGAGDAIAALRATGLAVKFATNTSVQPRSALVERLRQQGVDANPEDMFTAPRAAAAWLANHGITRVSLHVSPMTVEEFTPFTIDEQKPEAVVLGDLGDDWTVERLNRIFRHVIGGAQLLAIQKNRYWKRGGAFCLDAGPFVAAIEYATDTSAVVAGKPSEEFFVAASAAMGIAPAELVVVGDDVRTDVGGAQSAGARGVLVRTGKFRAADLEDPDVRPDFIIDDIGQLPAALHLKWTSS
jgi:HAD superfamily hydrolase (TIGR01458 family)